MPLQLVHWIPLLFACWVCGERAELRNSIYLLYLSGHADGIYIPLVGYVSLNKPCIPPVFPIPVQSGHSEQFTDKYTHTLTQITQACFYLVTYYLLWMEISYFLVMSGKRRKFGHIFTALLCDLLNKTCIDFTHNTITPQKEHFLNIYIYIFYNMKYSSNLRHTNLVLA